MILQVDRAVEHVPAAVVRLLHDLVAVERPVRMAGEQREQVELGGADVDVARVGAEQAALVEVEQAGAEGDAAARRRRGGEARRRRCRGGRRGASVSARRSTARTRASSSRISNGLGT